MTVMRGIHQAAIPLRKGRKAWCIKLGIAIAGTYMGLAIFVFSHFQSILETPNSAKRHLGLGLGLGLDADTVIGLNPAVASPATTPAAPSNPYRTMIFKHPSYSVFNRDQAEQALAAHGASRLRQTIAAFLEPPMRDIIPMSRNQGDPRNRTDPGQPPQFIVPLPLRTQTPDELQFVEYPKLQTCHDLPAKLPVDRGLFLDPYGKPMPWNLPQKPDPRFSDLPHCPVDADPFLPWIHDLFPSNDGTKIHFVAQNKRRCNTGDAFRDVVWDMQPQVALFQHVAVKRVTNADTIAPTLWRKPGQLSPYSYQLVPMEDADMDGRETRFICRFHVTSVDDPETLGQPVFVGETLSAYPFNYEFIDYRRLHPSMLNPRATDMGNPTVSTLMFHCPVPEPIQTLVASGESILSDGTPMLHVDVVPIRTSPRYGTNEVFLSEDMIGPKRDWHLGNYTRTLWRNKEDAIEGFDARKRWGDNHVLPAVEASGRWTNLPICKPTSPQAEQTPEKAKPYELIACVWASVSYSTRGHNEPVDTTVATRLQEWLEFARLVGIDHVIMYDNSAANAVNASLAPFLKPFGDFVTRVEWPHVVCNNNNPGDNNCGERSSQYAAENSCRIRYGPETDWIANFDLDEYLVPMGTYENLKDVLRDAYSKGHKILSFRSSRTKLRFDQSVPPKKGVGRIKKEGALYLEAYNCDAMPTPKLPHTDRARKEIFRADHVLYHFVHYSLVTKNTAIWYKDDKPHWQREIEELAPPPHVTDEINEAVMVHTKGGKEDSNRWRNLCQTTNPKCLIGFPKPFWLRERDKHSEEGYAFNCFPNKRVGTYWIPKLKEAMAKRLQSRHD